MLIICPDNAQPTDGGEWSVREHRVPLAAVKPGEPFRQLGVYANMRGGGRKQLGHIKKRVEPGTACLAKRGNAKYAGVLLVANAAILEQAMYGLQFTTISDAGTTSLMGKSRKVALHAAHVASAEPRGLTGTLRDLRGLGPINWHTATTANKTKTLH